MGFLFRKKKPFFTGEEQTLIVDAIKKAETATSGEVRIYVESKVKKGNVLERAAEVFFKLKMQETKDRNGVLVYIAHKDHELALFADEGIYKQMGPRYWEQEVERLISDICSKNLAQSIANCVLDIGEVLKDKFPYDAVGDKNELPDEIVFGK